VLLFRGDIRSRFSIANTQQVLPLRENTNFGSLPRKSIKRDDPDIHRSSGATGRGEPRICRARWLGLLHLGQFLDESLTIHSCEMSRYLETVKLDVRRRFYAC
jgi:hypothetical protein